MQQFDITGTATTNDGVEIPIKITVEYPDNQGLIAWNILQHTAETGFEQVIQDLIAKGDLSLLAKMQENGMEAEYDEFGDDD
ncbi:hypothetical protein [Glutamicibacter sp.]|uniref:hypothetical protein n=1 Tax=Glutamicibacter sp. TaxID=1931995 RepID=UPI002FE2EBD1